MLQAVLWSQDMCARDSGCCRQYRGVRTCVHETLVLQVVLWSQDMCTGDCGVAGNVVESGQVKSGGEVTFRSISRSV